LKHILIVGGGFQSLIITKLLNEYGSKPSIIDSMILGGTISSFKADSFIIDKVPFFLWSKDDVNKLSNIVGEFETIDVDLEPTILKPGPLLNKAWARRVSENIEKPWPLKWRGKLLYPKNGWYEILHRFTMNLKYGHIPLRLKYIDLNSKLLKLARKSKTGYDILISTIPLVDFIRMIDLEALNLTPLNEGVKYSHMISISLGVKGKDPGWTLAYHGGTGMLPHTMIVMSKVTKLIVPENHFTMTSIISYSEERPLRAGFLEQVESQLKRRGIIPSIKDIVVERVFNVKYACINPKDISGDYLTKLKNELSNHHVFLYGRLANWREYSISELIGEAKSIVNQISEIL